MDLSVYGGAAFREGREEGEIEGMEIGKAECKAEEKQAVAIRLHQLGLSTAMISAATGLSEEQLTKLFPF